MKYSQSVTKDEAYYTHNLNTLMVEAFIEFYEKWKKTRTFVIVMNEKELPGLTLPQRTNFQKLKHFGLIKSVKGHNGYVPTCYGIEFYSGRKSCKNIVATFQNIPVPYDHECWETHSTFPEEKFIHEYLSMCAYSWKQRKEYQEERNTNLQLFY